MTVFLRVIRLLLSVTLLNALFLSFLHAHSIKIQASESQKFQPNIDFKKGIHTIDTVLPDENAISVNEFEIFDLDGTPPIIEVDEDTKVLISRVKGKAKTQLKNVHGIVAQNNGRKINVRGLNRNIYLKPPLRRSNPCNSPGLSALARHPG